MKNLNLKKSMILGMAQIGSISAAWILGVANSGFNYLRHFTINFDFFFGLLLTWLQISWNFWNFPNIEFVWFWRMLWTKPPKIEISHRNRANPEIWPFLKMRFFNFFVNHMPQKYKDENRPYSILNGQKKPKHQEKSGKKWGI